MKILVIHNRYQQRGGEAVAVEQEIDLLQSTDHDVIFYWRGNDEVRDTGLIQKASIPLRTVWAQDTVNQLRQLIKAEQPDVAHIHNTHFMISPAAVHICHEMGVPVVMTLHNYRLLCPVATFFRDGQVCEDCLSKSFQYPAVMHGCFRGRAASTTLAVNNAVHRTINTWDKVDLFVTPTAFARQKLIEGGFDGDKIVAKAHFLNNSLDTTAVHHNEDHERFMLYAGRLSPEKGTHLLLEAWKALPDVPLKIVGDGPLMPEVERLLTEYPDLNIDSLGYMERDQLINMIESAETLIFPSTCYETFGMSIIEAFAVGTPVIAAGHGAPGELVTHGENGLHFTPGSADHLREQVCHLWDNPQVVHQFGQNARETYQTHYTAEKNADLLQAIYDRVLERQ